MKNKWKKRLKRVVPFLLVGVIAFTSVSLSYRRVSIVKAEAITIGLTTLAIVTLLASAGVYLSYDWLNDGNNALQLEEGMESHYEQERLTLIQGGAGGDPDDPDDDNDPEKIPTWRALLETVKTAGALDYSTIVASELTYGLLNIVANTLFGDAEEGKYIPAPEDIELPDEIMKANYKYCLYFGWEKSGISEMQFSNFARSYVSTDTTIYYHLGEGVSYDVKTGKISSFGSSSGFLTLTDKYGRFGGTNFEFMSKEEFDSTPLEQSNPDLNNPGNVNPDVIWTTPELQDQFKNDGKFETYPPFDPLNISSLSALRSLQQAMDALKNLDPLEQSDAKKQAINDFMNTLQPEPGPGTDPDKPIDPDPDNPDKPVKPDNPDNPKPEDPDNESFLADLSKLFPFCIPFDLIHAIKVFNAEPETPHIEIPINIRIIGYSDTLVLDLGEFESAAAICRTMFLLLFIVGLILATRGLIRG